MTLEEKEKSRIVIASRMKDVISLLGEDVDREGLIKTPEFCNPRAQPL